MVSATAHASAIELLQSHSLTTLVQRELERRILAGDLAPGDKLNEEALASQFNALARPGAQSLSCARVSGLVRTEKNRASSCAVSIDEADEIYEVRAGLDELIGRLLASRIQPGQLTQLRELLKKMQQAARGRSVEHYYPLNVQFHGMLAEFTGNGTLLNHYRRLVNELHLYRRETLARGPDSFPISTREHAAIVDALARRDGDRAGKLMYEHAMESRERLHAALKGRRQ
jgi:DNA-binding GntR family transcriptional regulator